MGKQFHSYADYERAERYELRGTITEIRWGNPHILFMVHTDTVDMRIEWVTATGADKTSVSKDQFAVGDELTVIGSRNHNPDIHIMTLVKELLIPQKNFHWISPQLANERKQPPLGL
jgi:hypothetical protein